MKIAILGDCHFGARNDSHHIFEHFSKFYNDIFFPYLKNNDIKTIIQLGDFTDHRRYINFMMLNRIKSMFTDVLVNENIDFHTVVGNHDIYHRNSLEINSCQELFEHDSFHVYSKPTAKTFDGLKIDFIPWITKNNEREIFNFIDSSRSIVSVGHFEFSGFDMYAGISANGKYGSKMVERYDLVLSGHFHHKSKRKNIEYCGTPYEICWNDYGDSKGFHIFDTKTLKLNYIPNKNTLHEKIFLNSSLGKSVIRNTDFSLFKDKFVKLILTDKSKPVIIDQFSNEIISAGVQDLSIIDSELDSADIAISDSDVIKLSQQSVLTVLNKMSENHFDEMSDINRMNEILKEIYNEAILLENEK